MTPFEQGLSGHGKLSINDRASLPYHLLYFLRHNPIKCLEPEFTPAVVSILGSEFDIAYLLLGLEASGFYLVRG